METAVGILTEFVISLSSLWRLGYEVTFIPSPGRCLSELIWQHRPCEQIIQYCLFWGNVASHKDWEHVTDTVMFPFNLAHYFQLCSEQQRNKRHVRIFWEFSSGSAACVLAFLLWDLPSAFPSVHQVFFFNLFEVIWYVEKEWITGEPYSNQQLLSSHLCHS